MKRKPFKPVLSLVLALLLCAAPFTGLSAQAAGSYTEWKQYDSPWASVVLTNKTMKQVGCLVTAVAILAVQSGCKDEDSFHPGILAEGLKKVGGFTAANDLIWEKIPQVIPGFEAVNPWLYLSGSQAEKTARLQDYLNQGYAIAVAVRNENHWVALEAVTGGTARMMDPASSETALFSKYAASGVTRAALLRADAPAGEEPAAPAEPRSPLFAFETFFGLLGDLCNLDMLRSLGELLRDLWNLLAAVGKSAWTL